MQIERDVLYHFIMDLESYRTQASNGKEVIRLKHLSLLIDYLKAEYKSTIEHVHSLLKRREITYDLLPFLFRPNSAVFSICSGTGAPRCLAYNHGEVRVEMDGSEHFCVEGRYFDFDGKAIGEAIGNIEIEKFRGSKPIDLLEAFPLRFHPDVESVREELVQCGRTFLSLRGIHHRNYEGDAFTLDDKGNINPFHVKGEIIIDAVSFRDYNPKYPRRRVNEKRPAPLDVIFGLPDSHRSAEVKHVDIDPEILGDDELVLFCPTVLGFSLNEKAFCRSSGLHTDGAILTKS